MLQCRVKNQILPEKPLLSTVFKESIITNARLDSLFSTHKSFTHSLQDDEYEYGVFGSSQSRKWHQMEVILYLMLHLKDYQELEHTLTDWIQMVQTFKSILMN